MATAPLKEQLVALQLSVTGSFLATVMFCGCSTIKGAFCPLTGATTSLKHENVSHFYCELLSPEKRLTIGQRYKHRLRNERKRESYGVWERGNRLTGMTERKQADRNDREETGWQEWQRGNRLTGMTEWKQADRNDREETGWQEWQRGNRLTGMTEWKQADRNDREETGWQEWQRLIGWKKKRKQVEKDFSKGLAWQAA
jgi:hypothetical protein